MAQTTISVSGGDLYHVAAVWLGDATQAVRIALLNGLVDFNISGPTTLLLPPRDASQTGGVPQQ